VQCSSDSRIKEATSASVKFSVIVMCAAVNLQSEYIRYPIRTLVVLLVTLPTLIYVAIYVGAFYVGTVLIGCPKSLDLFHPMLTIFLTLK
jgi:hypothetical protein